MGLFSTYLQKSQKSPSGLLIANPANPANWDDQKDAGLAGIEAGLAAPRMKIEDSCSANPASNPANQDDQNEAGLAGLAGLAISSPKDEDCDFLLPAWAPAPHPRIALESPFGLDRPPLQLRAAWIAVCAESPAGIDPVCFEAAMFNVAQLFGEFAIVGCGVHP